MSSSKQALGRWGENLAADYLTQKGYVILEQNFRTPYGELDLIVQDASTLVFVEIKTRSTDTFGLPEASITSRKQQHIVSAALAYMQAASDTEISWRIDVIAIRKNNSGPTPEITHFKNAIT
jgi:putative endonuclease